MAIPLVDNNGKNSINTSVIAIKKEIEQINSLLQNFNNKLKSLSDNDFNSLDISRVGAYCTTAGSVADKVASMQGYTLTGGNTFPITFDEDNTASSALTLNIAGTGAKAIYINGDVSSASNYTLKAGTYICRYNGANYYIDTSYGVPSARQANTASSCSGNSATASAVRDSGNNTSTTLAYSKTALSSNPTWLAAWNSYELRAVSPANVIAGKANIVAGVYTGSGGQQNPQYVGKGQVRFNMMNTPVMGNSNYKNWLIMDCYTGFDVGGVTALGLDRSSLRAFIMRSDAGTSPNRPTAWASSGELLVSSGQSLNSDNGYVVCTNGLKIRWGYISFSAFSKGSTITLSSGTLSPAFSSNTYKLVTTIATTEAGGEQYITAKSASSFTVKIYNRNSGTTIPAGSLYYLAIGY